MARFIYKSRLENEERHSREKISSKEMYRIGLICGSTLKGSIHDKRIISALRSGNPVYVLARDMTLFWNFLKDQYPNVYPVYNVNRKAEDRVKDLSIKAQIDFSKKSLVIDTGFSGSCVTPITSHKSAKFGHDKHGNVFPYTKGMLLSGAHRLNDYGKFDCIRTERESKTYRNVVLDLEHSPKPEITTPDSTYSNLAIDKQFIAFRLGFFSGLMGLNKAENKNIIRKEQIKKKLKERRNKAKENFSGLGQALHKVDLIAEFGFCWAVTEKYDKTLGSYSFVTTQGINHKSFSPDKLWISNYGYHRAKFSSKAVADKYAKIYNRIMHPTINKFSDYAHKERNILYNLKRIETFESEIIRLESKLIMLKGIKNEQ